MAKMSRSHVISLSDPAVDAEAVTKSDSTVVDCRGIYVGGVGDVAIWPRGGDAAVVFKAVPAGTILPVQASKIMSTDTTATDIVALY